MKELPVIEISAYHDMTCVLHSVFRVSYKSRTKWGELLTVKVLTDKMSNVRVKFKD